MLTSACHSSPSACHSSPQTLWRYMAEWGYEHRVTVRFHHVVHVPFKVDIIQIFRKHPQVTTLDICQHYVKACFSNHVSTKKKTPHDTGAQGSQSVVSTTCELNPTMWHVRVTRFVLPIPGFPKSEQNRKSCGNVRIWRKRAAVRRKSHNNFKYSFGMNVTNKLAEPGWVESTTKFPLQPGRWLWCLKFGSPLWYFLSDSVLHCDHPGHQHTGVQGVWSLCMWIQWCDRCLLITKTLERPKSL